MCSSTDLASKSDKCGGTWKTGDVMFGTGATRSTFTPQHKLSVEAGSGTVLTFSDTELLRLTESSRAGSWTIFYLKEIPANGKLPKTWELVKQENVHRITDPNGTPLYLEQGADQPVLWSAIGEFVRSSDNLPDVTYDTTEWAFFSMDQQQ
jgi:hypothetical protein